MCDIDVSGPSHSRLRLALKMKYCLTDKLGCCLYSHLLSSSVEGFSPLVGVNLAL